jgi:hypothetical protein
MITIEISIWAIQLVLIPYLLLKKKFEQLPAPVLVFILLTIPILIGINTPNPDNVQLIQVTVP